MATDPQAPQPTIDETELWRQEVERARCTDPIERLRDGFRLFELGRALMVASIRTADPLADEATIATRVRERLAIVRRLEAQP